MIKKIKDSKKRLVTVGVMFVLLGIIIISNKNIYNYIIDKKEEVKIEEFYRKQEHIDTNNENTILNEKLETTQEKKFNYIAVIKIPKIGVEKGLCQKESSCNHVDRNIQILNESDYPDVKNGNFMLAAHSGNAGISYFKNVYKLEKDNLISLIYNGYEYKYKIVNIYDVEKTGSTNIIRNKEKNTLTLITCRQKTDNQIIVISELIERTKFNG